MIAKEKSIPANRLMVVSGLYTQQRAPELLTLLAGVRDQETQRMRALRHHGPLDDASHGDEGDSAARDEDRELAVSLAQLAGSRVAAVENVLERMRNGRYGVCERCEEDIPIERLEAMPSTVLCVDCQREHETASKNVGADAPYLWVTASEPPSISSEISDSEGGGQDRNSERDGGARARRGRPRSANMTADPREPTSRAGASSSGLGLHPG